MTYLDPACLYLQPLSLGLNSFIVICRTIDGEFNFCSSCSFLVATSKHKSVKRQNTKNESRRQVLQVDYAAENLELPHH